MKTFASFSLLIILTLLFNSCKKSTTEVQVQYKIDPVDSYIIQINYTDQSGKPKTIDDISQIQNGTETILVTKKPFTVTLDVKVNNNTNASRNYNLLIYVDGQVKSWSNFTAPPMTSLSEKQIEYIIN
jgi:hypothetical protein